MNKAQFDGFCDKCFTNPCQCKPIAPNDYSINTMVSFLKDQSWCSQDYLDGYRAGLIKMRELMLDIVEKMK